MMNDIILIHSPETPCLVGCDKSIKAMIVGVKIAQNSSIIYEVAWANSSGYTDTWMMPCEIEVDHEPTRQIGFVQP